MSGILLNNAAVGNPFMRFTASGGKTQRQFYFDANGYVAASDPL
jgi:hypothetical protein